MPHQRARSSGLLPSETINQRNFYSGKKKPNNSTSNIFIKVKQSRLIQSQYSIWWPKNKNLFSRDLWLGICRRLILQREIGSNLATTFFKVALFVLAGLTYLDVSQLSVDLSGKR